MSVLKYVDRCNALHDSEETTFVHVHVRKRLIKEKAERETIDYGR